MLQSFRDNLKGVAAAVLVGMLAIPFVLTGVDYLFVSGSSVESAAEVNGEKISRLRVEQAIASEKTRILDQNPDIDRSLLDDEKIRPAVLQRLIDEKIQVQAARDSGMGVAQKAIGKALLQIDAFRRDGKFDKDLYLFALRNHGYTSASFTELIGEDMLRQQFTNGLLASGFVTPQDVRVLAKFTEQTRDYHYLMIEAKPLRESVQVNEEQVQDYFDKNKGNYQTSEQVKVEYVELDAETLADQLVVNPEEIKARFEQEAQTSHPTELRHAAHIQRKNNDDGVVDEIQRKLSKGADFAELARQYSQDIGSAENGGDLGTTDGSAFPESFEKALSALQPGEVSGPVTTESGIHLIKLIDVEKHEFNLASESARIEKQLRVEKAERLLAEKVEQLKELSFNTDSLKEVAQELGLKVSQSEPFSRSGGSGIAAYPAVLRAAFTDDVLENRYASEVLDLGDQHYVVLKLLEHIPARQKTLDEVRTSIADKLQAGEARRQIQEQADAIQTRARNGETIEAIAKDLGLQWQVALKVRDDSADVNPEIRNFVFRMPVPAHSKTVDGLFLSGGDYAVIALNDVIEGDVEKMDQQQRRNIQYTTLASSSSRELTAYDDYLKSVAEVEKFK